MFIRHTKWSIYIVLASVVEVLSHLTVIGIYLKGRLFRGPSPVLGEPLELPVIVTGPFKSGSLPIFIFGHCHPLFSQKLSRVQVGVAQRQPVKLHALVVPAEAESVGFPLSIGFLTLILRISR